MEAIQKMTGGTVMMLVMLVATAKAYDSHHPNPMDILSGRHVHRTPIVEKEDNTTKKPQPWRMYKRRKEGRYVIKPEPYSIGSQKSDPELLGPQRTITASKRAVASASSAVPSPAPAASKSPTLGIGRNECITMIGQEKFDVYVKKYGGETGALHRCLILKRLRK